MFRTKKKREKKELGNFELEFLFFGPAKKYTNKQSDREQQQAMCAAFMKRCHVVAGNERERKRVL